MNSTPAYPEWVDARLSQDLPSLRLRGEGQSLEYMRDFPAQVRELGKEIAAFASSNAGTILIGIGDDGTLVGIEPITSAAQRDQLLRRIEGICHGAIKPAVTPTVRFATEGSLVVAVVDVPKGREPVYYCHNIPYVRHLSQSRPAEPSEVVAFVADALRGNSNPTRPDEYVIALSDLIFPIADVLIFADQLRERRLNPWIGQLKSSFASAARAARSVASNERVISHGHGGLITHFARAAEAAALHQSALGRESWGEFQKLVVIAATFAAEIDASLISQLEQDSESTRRYLNRVRTYGREVAEIASRIQELWRLGTLPSELSHAAMIGYNLLHAHYFPFNHIPAALRQTLWTAGRSIHVTETLRLGHTRQDVENVQHTLEQAAAEINDFADTCFATCRDDD